MDVLYITAACLTKNTSANMSHNAFVQGLLENGASVDIIMANDSFGAEDSKLKRWDGVDYYEYNSVSFSDRAKRMISSRWHQTPVSAGNDSGGDGVGAESRMSDLKVGFRKFCKKIFYLIFRQDPLYPLEKVWLSNASHFKSDKTYDLIISNSSPSASHRLAEMLIHRHQINYKRWIQIWEDPWFHGIYGGHSLMVLQEEERLLKVAEEILYVSPLTLHYQQQYFPSCAHKMGYVPLPSMQVSDIDLIDSEISFGYFGDYYSHTRNLKPFYEALLETNVKGLIYGDSDLILPVTSQIKVSGRVTLEVLQDVQNQTSVLVHLCNLRGGQIPGKIYHYSATKKPILFILDGTEEEKIILKNFFSKYDRYVFCDNNVSDISNAILKIKANPSICAGMPVEDFSPKNVVASFLNVERDK